MTSTELNVLLGDVAGGLEKVQNNFPHELVSKLIKVLELLEPGDFAKLQSRLGFRIEEDTIIVLKKLDELFAKENSKAQSIIKTCRNLQSRSIVLRIIARCMS